MEGAIVLHSGTSKVVWFFSWTLYPDLTFDGFEDVMVRELQRSEAVVHPVGFEWALLRVQEWFLLESTLSASLDVDGGVSMMRLQFCFVVVAVERWVGEAFHCLLQLDVWLGSVHDLALTCDIVLHHMLIQRVGDPQSVDECESRRVFTAVVYFG